MLSPLLDYLDKFENAFIAELNSESDEIFKRAWLSSTNRTELYGKNILAKVSARMGLTYVEEDFKIDYTFCQKVNDYLAPEIFIESENNAKTACHEIRKLCCLNAPLKVLITCTEWSDEPGFWKHGGMVNHHTAEWQKQIQAHSEVWPQTSITLIIVAEWNHTLRFYSLAFDNVGNLIRKNRIIHERKCS